MVEKGEDGGERGRDLDREGAKPFLRENKFIELRRNLCFYQERNRETT